MKREKIDFKSLKLAKNENRVKDPVRYPKVIDVFENDSKRDFRDSLSLMGQHLRSEMYKFVE